MPLEAPPPCVAVRRAWPRRRARPPPPPSRGRRRRVSPPRAPRAALGLPARPARPRPGARWAAAGGARPATPRRAVGRRRSSARLCARGGPGGVRSGKAPSAAAREAGLALPAASSTVVVWPGVLYAPAKPRFSPSVQWLCTKRQGLPGLCPGLGARMPKRRVGEGRMVRLPPRRHGSASLVHSVDLAVGWETRALPPWRPDPEHAWKSTAVPLHSR